MHELYSVLRLYELAMVMVPGYVENERMFSAMNFIRSDRRNRLQAPHLTACTRLFKDALFTPSPFPYAEAIGIWHAGASLLGSYMGCAAAQKSCHAVLLFMHRQSSSLA